MSHPAGIPLPALRQDLRLYPAPDSGNGASRWTLEDPIRGRFYQLGWLETEFLANWSESPQKILSQIIKTTTLRPKPETLNHFLLFLRQNHLVDADADALIEQKKQCDQRESWLRWVFRRHLSFRVSLFKPDAWLGRRLPLVLPFMSRTFLGISMMAAMLGLWLASRQWSHFVHGFSYLFSFQGAAISVATIISVKMLHEFGHAFTCKKYGAPVSTMGIMFILFWPVLYTDVSGAWRLKNKHHRMMIGAAGILTEAVVAAWSLLLWNFTDDGILQSVLFTLATTSFFLSLSINLSPLMRFDGYFILSDWLDMANMQPRAFAMGRWAVRKSVLGWQTKPPERFSRVHRRGMIIYAFATWIYRCSLYFGIALAVYHLVFKALGIMLFSLEIIYLLIVPLLTEIGFWIRNRKEFRVNMKVIRSGVIFVGLLSCLLFPWHHTVRAPAVLMAQQQRQLFVADDSVLIEQKVKSGDEVKAGQLLFKLSSLQMNQTIDELQIQSHSLKQQILSYPFDKKASADLQVIRDELNVVRRRLIEQKKLREKLTIRAPYHGVMADLPSDRIVGSWMAAGTVLARIIGTKGVLAEAYINERDIDRIHGQKQAVFIPENLHLNDIPLSLDRFARGVVSDLRAHPELSSPYGGAIAAHLDRRKRAPIPEQAIYQAYLSGSSVTAPDSQLRGEIVIEGKAQSLISRVWDAVIKIVIRESVM